MTSSDLASGGLFRSPGGMLAFLAAAVGAGLADDATCRQGPDGQWMATVAAPWQRGAPLVRAAGGRAYAGRDAQWYPISMPAGPPSTDATCLDISTWSTVTLDTLLRHLPLQAAARHPLAALEVVVPAALGRWALRRAAARGLQLRLTAARRQPVTGDGQELEGMAEAVFLLHLTPQPGATIPWSLVHTLSSLPYTTAAQALGTGDGRLLVDVHHTLPLAQSLLSGLVPDGEIWVLDGSDVGHARLRLDGAAIDGSVFLRTNVAPAPTLPADRLRQAKPLSLPKPLSVRLVPGPDDIRTDALLLDDATLRWLRPFLMTRPLGERAFLLPGDGHHLLVAPGGLATSLPFGRPLRQVGPGGLYVESGLVFYPPLPVGARQEIFGAGPTHSVAVVKDGEQDRALRFEIANLMPAWTLWAGPAPEIQHGLSATGEALLSKLAASLRSQEPAPAAPIAGEGGPNTAVDRTDLLRAAQEAELAGDLVTAAERLEAAGELGPAGRLYERAARSER